MALPPPSIEYRLAQAIRHPEQRDEFWSSLLSMQVTVAGKPSGEDSVALGYLTYEGGPIYPFFTSQHVYWGTVAVRPDFGPENLILPTGTLMQMTAGQRLVLNPDGPFNVILEPDDVDQLLTVGVLPADRGVALMASEEQLQAIELEHELTQINGNPEAEASARQRIMESEVSILANQVEGGMGEVAPGSSIEAIMLTDEQGPVCPLFTSDHMVRASMAGIPNLPSNKVTMKGAAILDLVESGRFVVNPHGPSPFFFR